MPSKSLGLHISENQMASIDEDKIAGTLPSYKTALCPQAFFYGRPVPTLRGVKVTDYTQEDQACGPTGLGVNQKPCATWLQGLGLAVFLHQHSLLTNVIQNPLARQDAQGK